MINTKTLGEEYISEISKIEITAKELLEAKVQSQILKTEIYLERIYGDKICHGSKAEGDFGEKQKSIHKITEDDIGMGSNIKSVCNSIDESKFDENLIKLLR